MSASKAQLTAKAEQLRKRIAASEALLDDLRAKLAKAEAQIDNRPAPMTGLDMLWAAALPISRTRSSKIQCRTEWNRIPACERPSVKDAVAALKIWNRCDEWRKDGNSYARGLHIWIKYRQWEHLPEDTKPDRIPGNPPTPPRPIVQHSHEDLASHSEIAAAFEAIKKVFPDR